jgi:hypothetical protein
MKNGEIVEKNGRKYKAVNVRTICGIEAYELEEVEEPEINVVVEPVKAKKTGRPARRK